MKIPNARQFAVIGLGRFGSALARQLYSLGKEVLAVDVDEQHVADIAEYVTHSMTADCLDEHTLKQIAIDSFDVVIVAIGNNMQANILVTQMCKEMGVKFVIAKAQSFLHAKVLEKIGANMVVFPEAEAGYKLAQTLSSPAMVELAEIAPDFKIIEIEVPEAWIDKSLIDLKIRQKYLLTVLVVHRAENVIASPAGDFVLQANDKVVVCGEAKDLSKLSKLV